MIQDLRANGEESSPATGQPAFVVQLHADAQPEQGQFRGWVEHLVSYQSAHFASVEELTAFMVRVLTADTHDTTNTGT